MVTDLSGEAVKAFEADVPVFQTGEVGAKPDSPHQLASCKIYLSEVITQEDKDNLRDIIATYHSYKTSNVTVGRRINWLIKANGETVGAIGIASVPALLPKCVYSFAKVKFVGASKTLNLNRMASNWRFTLTPKAPKNTGSASLAILRKIAPKRWEEVYNDELVIILTWVQLPRKGTIYRASGWKYLGVVQTKKYSGYGSKSIRKNNQRIPMKGTQTGTVHYIFALPLVDDWREKLIGGTKH